MEINQKDKIVILFSLLGNRYEHVMVNTSENHKKYWCYTTNTKNGTFTAYYGRIGNTPQTTTYPLHGEHKKRSEKFGKGYHSITIESLTIGKFA
jgi:hypothetical protein